MTAAPVSISRPLSAPPSWRARAWRHLIGRLLVMVLCAGALTPTVSHALADAAPGHWVPVCTAAGLGWLDVDSGELTLRTSAPNALEHCPYCSLHQNALLSAHADSGVLPAVAGDAHPPALPAAPFAGARRHHAQPRAPPALS